MIVPDPFVRISDLNCTYCGVVFDESYVLTRKTRDHVIPKKLGGSGLRHNIVPACASCNSSKGGRNVEQFRKIVRCRHPLWKAIYALYDLLDATLDDDAVRIALQSIRQMEALAPDVIFWGER